MLEAHAFQDLHAQPLAPDRAAGNATLTQAPTALHMQALVAVGGHKQVDSGWF